MAEITRHELTLGPLRPALRDDLHVTRQHTRGGVRYIVHDPITFQNHAFSALDYRILTAIVARRTLSQVFSHLVEEQVLEEDDKQAFYEFALWLHGAALLQLPLASGDAQYDRYKRRRAAQRTSWYSVFLHKKIPVCNPDRFLQRTMRPVRWLFSRIGVAAWAVLMLAALWQCVGRFGEMVEQTQGLLALTNLPILWVALVGLKCIHEFGHAYACRRFGGSVPEMGVVFILMTPCAYVDASSSWKFTRRRERLAVTLAGMYVETIVAGIFALIWAATPPGFLHDVALNVMLLATVATLLFNLNPLMRFDGYYAFSDLLGVFNLQDRATKFVKSRLEHRFLGLPKPDEGYTRSERALYGTFGPCAFAYRIFLAFAITGLVMMQWPSAGLLLGGVFIWALIVLPVARLGHYLWSSDDTRPVRARARVVTVAGATLAALFLGFFPVSRSVIARGVLDPRVRSSVRAPASGFVESLAVENGAMVAVGDRLCVLRNPELELRRLRVVGEIDSEQARLDAVELANPTQAATHKARLAYLRAGLAELDERLASMTVRATAGGTVSSPESIGRTGHFLRRGDELFQVVADHRFIRVVLTDDEVARARLEIGSEAEVRWACSPERTVRAVVREIRRSASRRQIPIALTMIAGGDVYAEPDGLETAEADQPYLHVFLETVAAPLPAGGTGLTARVRLQARVELLGGWIQRRLLAFLNSWRMS